MATGASAGGKSHDAERHGRERIGLSPINESGNPDNGMVSSIAINPNNPNVV